MFPDTFVAVDMDEFLRQLKHMFQWSDDIMDNLHELCVKIDQIHDDYYRDLLTLREMYSYKLEKLISEYKEIEDEKEDTKTQDVEDN